MSAGPGNQDQISAVLTVPDGSQVIVLTDGTTLELTPADVYILKSGFVGECEACGYDPDEDDEDITDEDEEEDE